MIVRSVFTVSCPSILRCAFGAHLDVGLAVRPTPCRFIGTVHVSFPRLREDGRLLIKCNRFYKAKTRRAFQTVWRDHILPTLSDSLIGDIKLENVFMNEVRTNDSLHNFKKICKYNPLLHALQWHYCNTWWSKGTTLLPLPCKDPWIGGNNLRSLEWIRISRTEQYGNV